MPYDVCSLLIDNSLKLFSQVKVHSTAHLKTPVPPPRLVFRGPGQGTTRRARRPTESPPRRNSVSPRTQKVVVKQFWRTRATIFLSQSDVRVDQNAVLLHSQRELRNVLQGSRRGDHTQTVCARRSCSRDGGRLWHASAPATNE